MVMTVVVCIQCGAIEHGAWTPCPECSFEPIDRSDMVTDHHFTRDQLEQIAKRFRKGLAMTFKQQQVDELVRHLETLKPK
jgi:hypothetical protein